MSMNNGHSNPVDETVDDVFEESQHDSSIRITRSYKEIIRKLENNTCFSQSEHGNSYRGSDSQYGIRESNIMKGLLDDAHELYKGVKGPHEARLDARVLKEVSRICRLRSQDLSVNQQKFQVSEFADKLIQVMGGSVKNEDEESLQTLHPKNWEKLGDKVQSIINTPPYFSYMLGSLPTGDNLAQPKKQRNPRNRNDAIRPATEAKTVDFDDKNSSRITGENMTDVFVESTYKSLILAYRSNDKDPICYFSFILDPHSFGRTVENMFYASFLIKEGKAKIYYQENDAEEHKPFIIPLKKRRNDDEMGQNLDSKKQALMTISKENWERLKVAFPRDEPMINHTQACASNA